MPSLGKLRRLRQNLGWSGIVGELIGRNLRRVLFPGARISYTQFGEDAVLDHVIGWRDLGFYVDVGANHPRNDSVTYGLYRRGWRGIAIDANASFAPLYRRLRPRDRFVPSLVSSEFREMTFHVFADSRLSSASEQHVEEWSKERPVLRQERLQSRPLTAILEECGAPARFDLLNLDVEGHEPEVLRSLDFSRYRPDVVLLEVHGLLEERPEAKPGVAYLFGQGYRLVSCTGFTALFRSET